MITDKMVEAAVEAQEKFLVIPRFEVNKWEVLDCRNDPTFSVGLFDSRPEAEACLLRSGQRAALEAADRAAWNPIESAVSLDRVLVSGWQKPRGHIAGYWWYHEDVTDEDGKPMEHPNATKFRPFPSPPEVK